MELVSKEDIDAPIKQVFKMLTDFGFFERAALRRGAEVQRVDGRQDVGRGMAWIISVVLRGKLRNIRLTLTEYDAPNSMTFTGGEKGMDGMLKVDLVALSRKRTRMTVKIELSATTLPARLLLQSLKLGRNKMQSRFNVRLAEFAAELEERFSGTAA
ncbi:SRPBCC family protein [Thalassovita aquimarina]|uniref:SRPBCC family protein n=1 Tax=Thalassovita aquimarina TaxID=2785917 RepID=A0ABS5HQ91_9RHOB|nr:SRPBCC family protein [Thalassovita aquimarina]MBR9651130.1 SRPBCC family protein [Thalassovita aquimarina]